MKTVYVRLAIAAALIALILIFWTKIRRALKIVWDPVSEKRLWTLHPYIREDARAFINEAEEKGYKLRLVSGLRTFSEQNELYAQGRTKPGNIVTHAKPGTSFHNYGLAIDVVEIKDGKGLWENPNWPAIAAIGKKHGFAWGGDWTFKDLPHFEKSPLPIGALLARYNAGQKVGEYVTLTT